MAQYTTVAEADAYFATRLHSTLWGASSIANRNAALIQATEMIDMLDFVGAKHVNTQTLEFPRGDDLIVPEDIKKACNEIAFKLLDGVDPESELENVGVSSEGYSSVRTGYSAELIRDHIASGIPSALAWRYLLRYLTDAQSFRLSRVS